MSEEMSFHAKQQLLNNLRMVNQFNCLLGTGNIIKAIYNQSVKEWANSINAANQEHLIRDVQASGAKTDAIRVYVSKLVKMATNIQSYNGSAWTVDTLCSENAITIATIARIGSMTFADNKELFTVVATKLLGYDKDIVNFAISDDLNERTAFLVDYLYRLDGYLLSDRPSAIYEGLVDALSIIDYEALRGDIALYAQEIIMADTNINVLWSDALKDAVMHYVDEGYQE